MNGIVLHNDTLDVKVNPVRDTNGIITLGMVVGNIDYQRCRMIIEAQKGEFKEYPTLGFGIDNYLKSVKIQKRQQFITEMTKELKSDGMTPRINVGADLSQFDIEL